MTSWIRNKTVKLLKGTQNLQSFIGMKYSLGKQKIKCAKFAVMHVNYPTRLDRKSHNKLRTCKSIYSPTTTNMNLVDVI